MDPPNIDLTVRDIVLATEAKLPQKLRTTLQETLRPELLSFLRDNATTLIPHAAADLQQLQIANNEALDLKLQNNHLALLSEIYEIKRQMQNSSATQGRIEACLKSAVPSRKQQKLLEGRQLEDMPQTCTYSKGSAGQPSVESLETEARESLREVCAT